jgi:plastocyanin
MRPHRPLSIGFLLALGLAAPASAADVTVADNFFDPAVVQIAPGETVTWRWDGSTDHNVRACDSTKTSPSGCRFDQTDTFRSSIKSGTGETFSHTFDERGRFRYFCQLHPFSMRGAVEVGPPPFPDTRLPRISSLTDTGNRLKFKLSEDATVRVRITRNGTTRKRIKKKLEKGRRAIRVRNLGEGLRYRAKLVPTDEAGNKGKAAFERFTFPD